MLGQYNLQISINYSNLNQFVAFRPELNILCVYDGILTIRDNSTIAQIGVVSKEDALTAEIRYDLCFNSLEAMYGGNFFGNIRDFFKQKVVPFAKKYGPAALQIGKTVAPLLGLGEGGAAMHRRKLKSRLHRV